MPPQDPKAPAPPDPEETARNLDELEELLSRIPGAKKLITEIRELRALLVERRAPRIACVGRRGAGKSSLANALIGAPVLEVGSARDTTQVPRWVDVAAGPRALRWFDTPGLRAADPEARRREVSRALRSEAPDVIVFVCRATEVDAGIEEDLDDLLAIRQAAVDARGNLPPLVAAVTKVDELPPEHLKAPPYDRDALKRERIDEAVATLRGHLARRGIGEVKVVPVATYLREESGALAVDWRWNLNALSAAVFDALPRPAQVEAARAFEQARGLRRRVAMRFVGTATSVAVVVGATPLPIADLALLLPLQTAMLTAIVYASGRPLGPRAAGEWLGGIGLNVSAAMGLREAVRALLKVVPGIGGPLSGAVAGTGTWALGVAAVRYFVDGVTLKRSREVYDQALRDGAPDDPAGSDPPPEGGEG